jgi:hypothetical protein
MARQHGGTLGRVIEGGKRVADGREIGGFISTGGGGKQQK